MGGYKGVAVVFQSDRESTVTSALSAVGMPYTLNPSEPARFDAILTDHLSAVTIEWVRGPPIYLRLRGDLWRERASEGRRLSGWFIDVIGMRMIDGIITACPYLAQKARQRPGNASVWTVGLPIEVSEWPVAYHDRDGLKLLTLTNMDYFGKIEPLKEWIQGLNPWLQSENSTWVIGAKGKYLDLVREWADGADRVSVPGFVDAKEYLREADVLLHPSGFDIQSPNAILEGYASGLPVITNGYLPFEGVHQTATSVDTLTAMLEPYQNVEPRRDEGSWRQKFVRTQHSREQIGRKYEAILCQHL